MPPSSIRPRPNRARTRDAEAEAIGGRSHGRKAGLPDGVHNAVTVSLTSGKSIRGLDSFFKGKYPKGTKTNPLFPKPKASKKEYFFLGLSSSPTKGNKTKGDLNQPNENPKVPEDSLIAQSLQYFAAGLRNPNISKSVLGLAAVLSVVLAKPEILSWVVNNAGSYLSTLGIALFPAVAMVRSGGGKGSSGGPKNGSGDKGDSVKSNSDADVRKNAAETLSEIGDKSAPKKLPSSSEESSSQALVEREKESEALAKKGKRKKWSLRPYKNFRNPSLIKKRWDDFMNKALESGNVLIIIPYVFLVFFPVATGRYLLGGAYKLITSPIRLLKKVTNYFQDKRDMSRWERFENDTPALRSGPFRSEALSLPNSEIHILATKAQQLRKNLIRLNYFRDVSDLMEGIKEYQKLLCALPHDHPELSKGLKIFNNFLLKIPQIPEPDGAFVLLKPRHTDFVEKIMDLLKKIYESHSSTLFPEKVFHQAEITVKKLRNSKLITFAKKYKSQRKFYLELFSILEDALPKDNVQLMKTRKKIKNKLPGESPDVDQ